MVTSVVRAESVPRRLPPEALAGGAGPAVAGAGRVASPASDVRIGAPEPGAGGWEAGAGAAGRFGRQRRTGREQRPLALGGSVRAASRQDQYQDR